MAIFNSPYFNQVKAYWQSVAGDGVPNVSAFDLIQIPSALPDITFWEMYPDGRVICRMVGTAVIARMKSDITGVELSAAIPPSTEFNLTDDLRMLFSQPCALFQVLVNRHVTGKIARMETLTFPLAADKGSNPKLVTVNHMLETIKYADDQTTETLELMRTIEDHRFVDLGSGLPSVKNAQQITG
ncbi:PAS domain-containing protein [Parvibaculaceae bacterium PLY_AMNH_Bact1]|nr:PAS domain-containing protein [Parvibaculaceae bacterium PLY_AMNH_Bact1]